MKNIINSIIAFTILTICMSAFAQRPPREGADQVRLHCERDEMQIDDICEPCLVRNFDVNTESEMEFLQAQKCVIGNVAIVGPDYGNDGRVTELDFGNLRRIRGNLIVYMSFVQVIFESGLKVYGWTTVAGCPWLCWQEAQMFLDSVGTIGRVLRAGTKSMGCE